MYNDCWGTSGWTIVDYYLRKKASYYMVQKAYSAVLLSLMVQNNTASIYLINDTLNEYKGCTAAISVVNFNNEYHCKTFDKVTINKNCSKMFYEFDLSEIEPSNHYVFMRISDNAGNLLYENVDFFGDYKDLNIPKAVLSYELQTENEKVLLKIKSNALALNVRISADDDTECSDNFFYMQSGEIKEVMIQKGKTKEDIFLSCLNSDDVLTINI